MRKIVCGTVCLLLLVRVAAAHRIDEYLQATLLTLESGRVLGAMRLIPGVLTAPTVIASIDTNGDGVFSDEEQKAYAQRVVDDLTLTVDGNVVAKHLVRWSVPQPSQLRDGLGELHIDYEAELPKASGSGRVLVLTNHHQMERSVYLVNVVAPEDARIEVLAQKRDTKQTTYELDWRDGSVKVGRWDRLQGWMKGLQFASLFHLGLRHIAEGTDHLLFLLVLLLPAPLLAVGARWGGPASMQRSLVHVLGIVTAFTLGHSITLSLAAMGIVHVPEKPIEVLIAVSILVSAVHALRPLFPGREAWIAAGFGLVHGLAFAATLDRLALGRWERVAGILAFNMGIETMQLVVVVMLLPSLLLLSRTRVYTVLRVSGAVFAGAAATGWVLERMVDSQSRVDVVVNAVARHAVIGAVTLFIGSFLCWWRERWPTAS